MVNPNSTKPSCDGLDLFLREWSPEADPLGVVCLVHGLGEHCGRFEHVAKALIDHDFSVIALDLRGHGRSLGRRGDTPSYDALMSDIELLLEEAKARHPNVPLFLYGHSLGGNLALNYVLRRRPEINGVIATGPWLRLSHKPPALQMTLARLMVHLHPGLIQSNGLDPLGLSHDPAVANAYINDPLVHDKISVRLFFSIHKAGEWAILHAREFSLPLLLMHGAEDPITSPIASREFGSRVSACTLKVWDGLYHEIHNEPQQNEIIKIILEWLEEQLKRELESNA